MGCSSIFSIKKILGFFILRTNSFFIDARVFPPRLEPPVPKNKIFSNFDNLFETFSKTFKSFF